MPTSEKELSKYHHSTIDPSHSAAAINEYNEPAQVVVDDRKNKRKKMIENEKIKNTYNKQYQVQVSLGGDSVENETDE